MSISNNETINTPILSPLSIKFMKVVFSGYFLVAIMVTIVHIWFDFIDTKRQVLQNLVITQKAYERGLARAIWYVDSKYLKSELKGILENFDIVGVKIRDDKSKIIAVGDILKDEFSDHRISYLPLDSKNKMPETRSGPQLIEHSFPLIHIAQDNERYTMGFVTLYSSNQVVFNKLIPKIFLIIINAIIKTFALGIIILLSVRQLLGNPLAMMTRSASELNLENLENSRMDIGIKDRNELKILEEAFNTMIQKLMSARTELLENRQLLQDIIDNSSMVVFLKNISGKYLMINQRYESLFHITKSAIIGKTDYDVFPEDMADQFVENDRKALETDAPIEIEEIVPQDDGIHTYISIKFPLYDTTGKTYATCGIATDITERKKTEVLLKNYNQDLKMIAF